MRAKINSSSKHQMLFFDEDAVFPSTRFQGSKLKIVNWIWEEIKELDFNNALDAFGGTGSVGYLLKSKGKKVAYNDILKFNWYIGMALIENSQANLSDEEFEFLITKHDDIKYPTFIYDTFKNIYYTDEENRWLDTVVTNINFIDDIYKKALAYFALFQACIIKRPYNLFHRKNLYMRLSDIERNFGNKATWDAPFEIHYKQFIDEANRAVFSNEHFNKALNMNVFDIQEDFDLVYIDTPYISKKGTGVDYHSFYHFLEGIVNYPQWDQMIDYRTKHRRLKAIENAWTDKKLIFSAFDNLFRKFKKSIIVVSYRSDGIPSIDELIFLLKKYKSRVQKIKRKNYKYVLSTNHTEEVLLVSE